MPKRTKAQQIINLAKAKKDVRTISAKLGVSKPYVHRVLNRAARNGERNLKHRKRLTVRRTPWATVLLSDEEKILADQNVTKSNLTKHEYARNQVLNGKTK